MNTTIKHQTRNIILAIAGLLALQFAAKAQTNTFPASGNVGIGTTNPAAALQVEGENTAVSIRGTGQLTLQFMGLASAPDQGTSEIIDWNGKIVFRTVNSSYLTACDWLTVSRSANSYDVGSIALAPNNNTRVGIGTENPNAKLDVRGRISLGCLYEDMAGIANTERAIHFYSKGANTGIPDWTHTGGRIYSTNVNADIQGYGNAGGWDGQALVLEAGKNWENIDMEAAFQKWQLTLLGNGNVGINTAQPTHTLTVNGAIRAKEVIVDDTGWADYVFSDDYKLQSLPDLEQHIKATKHLPGIPSAAEVGKQGVSLGDMQTLLLSKIEELTLHQIDLNKRLNAQDEKLDQQSRELEALRQENATLKSQSR